MTTPPTGTVTFLFTDIEGSTQRWDRQRAAMKRALARHDALLQAAIEANGGHVFKTVGDAFHAAFASACAPIAAAVAAPARAARRGLVGLRQRIRRLKVRMAFHTGMAELRDGDYFGPPLNRTPVSSQPAMAARFAVAGHAAARAR